MRYLVKTVTVKVMMPEDDIVTNEEIESWFDLNIPDVGIWVTKVSKGQTVIR